MGLNENSRTLSRSFLVGVCRYFSCCPKLSKQKAFLIVTTFFYNTCKGLILVYLKPTGLTECC